MTDRMTPTQRSRTMSRVRAKDTAPELMVRRKLWHEGFRFRLHRSDLPGTPDIVLPRHRIVVQVHGCFWHQHPGCPKASLPSTRTDFWHAKLRRNVERDAETEAKLVDLGWKPLTVWECETKTEVYWERLSRELGS